MRAANSIYNIVLALWVGGMATYTFIVTPAIFRSFTRDESARIVDALFPGYFAYNLALSAVALLLAFLVWPDRARSAFRISLALAAAALVVNFYITFMLHPRISLVKRQVTSFETMPKDSPQRREFTRLHAISAVLNLAVLADGLTLLVISSSRSGR
jgi:hypothetical protein